MHSEATTTDSMTTPVIAVLPMCGTPPEGQQYRDGRGADTECGGKCADDCFQKLLNCPSDVDFSGEPSVKTGSCTECSSSAPRDCKMATCSAGYQKYRNGSCESVPCPEDSSGRDVPSGCVCKSGTSGEIVASTTYPFYTGGGPGTGPGAGGSGQQFFTGYW